MESTIDVYSGLWDFLTQRNLSHISPLECPDSELHDLSPHGEILEADTWTNKEGDTCHVLTNLSILNRMVEADFRSLDFRNLKFQNLSSLTGFYPKPQIW
jgi:hypothetical protein